MDGRVRVGLSERGHLGCNLSGDSGGIEFRAESPRQKR